MTTGRINQVAALFSGLNPASGSNVLPKEDISPGVQTWLRLFAGSEWTSHPESFAFKLAVCFPGPESILTGPNSFESESLDSAPQSLQSTQSTEHLIGLERHFNLKYQVFPSGSHSGSTSPAPQPKQRPVQPTESVVFGVGVLITVRCIGSPTETCTP